MFPLNFLGLLCFIINPDKNYNLFLSMFCLGLFYSFIMNISSNTGIYVISMGITISLLSSYIFIVKYINFLKTDKHNHWINYIIYILISITIIFQITLQTKSKLNYIFEDEPLLKQTESINYGIAKGLKTTISEKKEYENNYKELSNINKYIGSSTKEIFYLSKTPWLYLESRKK